MNQHQVEMLSLDELVGKNHSYRYFKDLLDFKCILKSVDFNYSVCGAKGFGKDRLLLCLILQFVEDLSDRQLARFLSENLPGKWFAEFSISEKTPDYTTICKFRNAIGCENISKIFMEVKKQLQAKNYMAEVFTFVDATALVSKLAMWEERDKAIADGYEKLNNVVIKKYSVDPDVRIGAKSKKKFWFGFKKHVSVDAQSGLINQVLVTHANTTDAEGIKDILPKSSAVLADKGYVGTIETMKERGLHPMVIQKNNMKTKNKDLDSWITKLRSPYERVFSKQNKRVRYKGIDKNQVAEFLYAIAHNFKRMLVLETA